MGLRSASVVRTRLGSSMLLMVPFGSSFVLERPVLTVEPFSGVEIHMEMDMDWKWMEMGHNL